MSAEGKKLLWISISACVFVLIVLAVGFALLSPKKGAAQAPAAIGNSAPPKAQDPQDFLSAPPPAPSLEQPRSQDGNMIIVYGDKPALPATATGTASPTGAPAATGSTPVPSGSASGGGPGGAVGATVAPTAASPAPAPAAASPAASTAASTSKPAPKAPAAVAAKRPSATPSKVRVNEYWIQAASFTSRGRADDLKQQLADKGIAALISVKDISGKSWYRVRVGPYAAKPEAEGWLGRLKGLAGCEEAYVSLLSSMKAKP